MGEGIKLWCFLLLLPFFAAIGHDIYVNYYVNEENRAKIEQMDIDPETYQSSDFGYLLLTYVPDIYDEAKATINENTWTMWIDPVLQLYTFVVALFPAALFFIWLFIARVFDIWPFARIAKEKNDPYNLADKRSGASKFKYKRR